MLSGLSSTGQSLKHISSDPIISVTSVDVLFTVISLLTWTFTRDLDVSAILENSIIAPFLPKHEKHVAFDDRVKRSDVVESEPEPALETTTPRKRGRPAKSKTALNGAAAASSLAGSVRRSARRATRSADVDSDAESTTLSHKAPGAHYESDADSAYQPSSTTKREVAETEADGATAADLVQSGEATALALFLAFAGGLGHLAAGALGAEVTGPHE